MIGNRVEELLLLSPRELVARLLGAEAEIERLRHLPSVDAGVAGLALPTSSATLCTAPAPFQVGG